MSEPLKRELSPPTQTEVLTNMGLADLINEELKAIADIASNAKRDAFPRALKLGNLLVQAKERVGHGQFGKWIQKNCHLSERSAQRYMQLKEEWPKIEKWLQQNSATVADLTLRKAEKIIGPKVTKSEDNSDDPRCDDPLESVKAHEDDLLTALKTLKKSDEQKAKEAATKIVQRLEDAELLDD